MLTKHTSYYSFTVPQRVRIRRAEIVMTGTLKKGASGFEIVLDNEVILQSHQILWGLVAPVPNRRLFVETLDKLLEGNKSFLTKNRIDALYKEFNDAYEYSMAEWVLNYFAAYSLARDAVALK